MQKGNIKAVFNNKIVAKKQAVCLMFNQLDTNLNEALSLI
jgi:hypothetical protein